MSSLEKYPKSNLNSISEVHPLAPLFLQKTNASGSNNHHIQVFAYDHNQKIFVDISEIVAKDLKKRLTKGSVSYNGIGFNVFSALESDFKDKYEKLTSIKFEGTKETFKKDEAKFFDQYVNQFLEKKENRLMFATIEEKNNSKFVYECVKTCGCSVKYASSRLKNNKRIALAAMLDDAVALRELGLKIKDDENYIKIAVEQSPNAYLYASQRIQKAIGDKDALNYLNSYLMHQNLNKNIEEKRTSSIKVKI